MFYLIGGAPRCGKTTIAKELSNKIGIPWISTDTIESVVMKYVSNEESEKLFPKKIIRQQTHQSNDEMYTAYTSDQIVAAYLAHAKSLEQAIEIFIESESIYEHNYILEGYHITPSLAATLEQKFKIKSVFVGREDASKMLNAITSSSQSHDWVITKTKDKNTYPLIAQMLTDFSIQIKQQAEMYNFQYIEMGDNFSEAVENIISNL